MACDAVADAPEASWAFTVAVRRAARAADAGAAKRTFTLALLPAAMENATAFECFLPDASERVPMQAPCAPVGHLTVTSTAPWRRAARLPMVSLNADVPALLKTEPPF